MLLFLFSKTYNKSWPRDLPMLWPQPTSDGMMATVTSVFSAGRKDWIFYLNLNRIWMDKLLLYFKWVVQLVSYSWTHQQLHNNRIISLSRIAIWLDPYLVKYNKKIFTPFDQRGRHLTQWEEGIQRQKVLRPQLLSNMIKNVKKAKIKSTIPCF